MTDSAEQQKIRWHSRRGMLELDLLLLPFATEVFGSLSSREQALYRQLLASEDQQLWSWLLQQTEPPEPAFKPLIGKILAHKAACD